MEFGFHSATVHIRFVEITCWGHSVYQRNRDGVNKAFFCIPLFSHFFKFMKIHVTCWISCSYLIYITVAELWGHLSNMKWTWFINATKTFVSLYWKNVLMMLKLSVLTHWTIFYQVLKYNVILSKHDLIFFCHPWLSYNSKHCAYWYLSNGRQWPLQSIHTDSQDKYVVDIWGWHVNEETSSQSNNNGRHCHVVY